MVVDDVVPADCNRPGWPRACRPNGPLWPSVIEKAFAKACGGYEKMDFAPRTNLIKSLSSSGDTFLVQRNIGVYVAFHFAGRQNHVDSLDELFTATHFGLKTVRGLTRVLIRFFCSESS